MKKLILKNGKKSKLAVSMDWQLHLIILLPIIFLIVFTYVPMFGLRLAFVEKLDYKAGIWGSKGVGFYWFEYMFGQMPEFYRAFRNTLIIVQTHTRFSRADNRFAPSQRSAEEKDKKVFSDPVFHAVLPFLGNTRQHYKNNVSTGRNVRFFPRLVLV